MIASGAVHADDRGTAMMGDVAALPEGTVTFLLTDVEGSTRLWSTDPAAAAAAIRRTYELIDECVRAHGGVRPVEQGEGDSTVSVFAFGSSAVAAALEVQLALTREQWPDGARVAVRMALHTGEAELRDTGNYMGATVIRCARLRDLATGGDILVSTATAGLVSDQLPTGAGLVDLGEHALRDLVRPERVWRLTHADLRPAGPLRSAGAGERTNLRRAGTELVGRREELAEIEGLLANASLVTLTGSGGVGKTRLAHEVAVRAAERDDAGAWWVDLAPVTDPTRVASTVAAAIQVPEEPGVPAVDSLLAWLESRRPLVVLDNCEHLVEAVAALADAVVERCPEVRLVATSREPLGVVGEVTWRTPSLAVPPAAADTVDAVASFDAVELFTRRARAARPGFGLTEDDARGVAEICRRLDGVPLAIELAAARIRTMSLADLRASLDDRFRTLTGGARTALARQRTLTASVAWSYDHLDAEEQRLFRRLSVFVGPFRAVAARDVCGDDDLPPSQVLGVLASLADRSLVEMRDDGRYRLLETLRHFAQEQAVEAGEIDTWRDRHLTWCRAVAPTYRVGPDLDARRFREGVELLGDLRQALTWALANDRETPDLVVALSDILERLCRCDDVVALGRMLHEAHEPHTPGWVTAMASLRHAPLAAGDLETMERQREALEVATDPLERSRLLLGAGAAALFEGRPEGEDAMREAVELAEAAGAPADASTATVMLAGFLAPAGRLREARPILDDLAQGTTVTDGPWAGMLSSNQGSVAMYSSSIPAAVRLFRHSAAQHLDISPADLGLVFCAVWGRDLELAREVHADRRWTDVGGFYAGCVGFVRAAPAVLAGHFDETAAALHSTVDTWTLGFMSTWLRVFDADVALQRGDRERAESDLEEVRAMTEGRNLPIIEAQSCVLRAGLALLDDEVRAAHDLAQQALAIAVDNNAALVVIDGLEAVAITDHRLGRGELAARLAGAADAQRERSGYRWRLAPLAAEVPTMLGDEALHDAVQEGRGLSLDEAVEYATRARGPRDRAAHGWDALTPAEEQVTRLVSEGCTNQEIAERLFVSVATVKTHLVHTYDKLDIHSRSELAAQAAVRAERSAT